LAVDFTAAPDLSSDEERRFDEAFNPRDQPPENIELRRLGFRLALSGNSAKVYDSYIRFNYVQWRS